MSTITTPQPAPQASVKITFSRKIIIRVLAVFIVAITAMIDFWLVALLAGSGQGYATTEIVFNLLDVAVSVAVGLVLWVLSND